MSKVVKAVTGAVSNVVSGVVKAVGSVVSGVVKAIGSVVSAVVNFVASPFMGMFGMPDVPTNDSESNRITGVLVQKSGTNVNVPVVYGYRKVGGIVTFAETGSDNNKYLWVAYVLSEGQCEGVREIWINDTQIPSSNIPGINNQQMVTVSGKDSQGVDSKLNGLTTLQLFKGGIVNNPADTNVGNVTANGIFKGAPSWKTTMNYNGLCTLFARFEWKETTDSASNPFSGGIPEVKVCLLGKKVAKLTTVDGNYAPQASRVSGSARPELYNWGTFGGGYTEAYSTNPAEILLDYLRNPMYGKGLLNSDIDWESFYVAAVKCNQSINYTSTASGPILTMNYVLDTNQTIFNNVKLILQNFRAYLPYSRGKYVLRIEDAGNYSDILSGSADIVASFDKDNLHGDITYTGIDRASKYNQVVVRYVDPDNFWSEQTVVYPESQQDRWDYQTIDGGRENKGEFTFAGITNYMIAKDMARLLFNKSREQDSISFTVSSQGFELEPGDNVYLNANILKFGDDPLADAIPWRIVSIKLNNDFTFSVGCVRNPDWIYPHVRAGERDYKYALYVPKGATRYYPAEPIGIPVGLRPPWYAPTSGTDPANPPPAPGVGILTDKINIYETVASQRSNGIFVVCNFLRPANPAYSGVILNYKQNLSSVTTFTNLEVNTVPGANQPVTFEIGPCLNNTVYRVESQVKYSTGDKSTAIGVDGIQIGVPQDGSGGGGGGTPVAPPVNLANNYLSYAFGRTELSGGLPLATRKSNFVLRQDITGGTNPLINGLEIFYKPSANPKWYRTTQSLPSTQGADIAFSLTFGARLYPLVPGSGGIPGSVDNYDFIFRFTYSDGKTSIYQYRALNCSVEYGAYGYDVYLFAADQGATVYAKELTSAYVPEVMGVNDIPETRNMTISLKSISNEISNSQPAAIYFAINPPATSDWVNWVGVRLYRYRVTGSGTPAWSSTDFIPVSQDVYSFYIKQVILYDSNYQYVMVPLVNYGGTTAEALQARYISGTIHNRTADADYPSNGNWLSKMTVGALEPVATALARLNQNVTVAPPRRDTTVANLSSTTLTTGGVPFSPRRVQFTLTQKDTGTPNGRIAGIKIYYKLNSNVYWKEADYMFSGGTYTEGSTITINSNMTAPIMELGYPSYPNTPYLEQNYDFKIRWLYNDGSESLKEVSFLNSVIEKAGGSYTFIVLGATVGGGGGANYTVGNAPNQDCTDIHNLLERNQPAGTVTDVRTITDTLSAYQLYAQPSTTPNTLNFWCSTPTTQMKSYLAGLKVEYRQVIGGTTTATNPVITVNSSPYKTSTAVYVNGVAKSAIGAQVTNVLWDVEYEFIVTPQVWYQGALTNANKSFYWRGKVHNRETETAGNNPYPTGANNIGNWFSRITPKVVDYTTAIGSLSAPYPDVDPVVRLQSITKVGTTPATTYHTVKFQLPASYTSFKVYRRSVQDIKQNPNAYFGRDHLYGVGWWEQFTPNYAADEYLIDGNRVVTLNLRPAISGRLEFNFYDFNSTKAINGTSNWLFAGYPATNTPLTNKFLAAASYGSPSEMTQILIVVTTATQSAKALLVDLRHDAVLPNLLTDAQEVDFTTATSTVSTIINPVATPTVGTIYSSNLNTIKRTLSEARSRVTSNIKVNNATYTVPTAIPPVL